MPIIQELLDFNRVIKTLKDEPIIVNDLASTTEEEKEVITNMVFTRYSSDMISVMPSCECGETKGEYAIGITCPHCNTQVKPSVNEDIESAIWFRAPDGVLGLINPQVWIMLEDRFTKSGFETMKWLTDTTYRPNVKFPLAVQELEFEMNKRGIPRGYNNFITHFDAIMEILFEIKDFKIKVKQVDYLKELIAREREKVFSQYIPLPNKSLLIVEKTNVGIYIDPIIVGAIDAIEMITGIDTKHSQYPERVRENRTIKAIAKLSEFYANFYRSILSKKPGIFRKHIFGSRSHFSFRAVISSLTNAHKYDEIHVPWSIGLTAFKTHLISKLLKLGFDYNKSVGYIYSKVNQYDPLLDSLLNELIQESRDKKGLVCLLARNPSLLMGSIQRVYITKFKTDPGDYTVGISILVTKSLNADFDGK